MQTYNILLNKPYFGLLCAEGVGKFTGDNYRVM